MNFLLFLPLFMGLFSADKPPAFSYGYVEGELKNRIYVAVADNDVERQYGLMNRVDWGNLEGMWFDFEEEKYIRMWMKNTHLPLDMVFISGDFHVVHIAYDAVPMSMEIIPSRKKARYVLELPAGAAESLSVEIGNELRFSAE